MSDAGTGKFTHTQLKLKLFQELLFLNTWHCSSPPGRKHPWTIMRSWRINSCITHKSAESPDIAMSPGRSTVWPRKWGSWRSRGNESKPLPFLCQVVDRLFYERGIFQSISALSPRKFSSASVKESMVKSYMYAPMN